MAITGPEIGVPKKPLSTAGLAKRALKSATGALGIPQKAIIEIADFSKRKVNEEGAPKAGGKSSGISGLGGFNADLAKQYLSKINDVKNKANSAIDTNTDGFNFERDFQRFRFEVPFNPSELSITGYGGEEMAQQNFSNSTYDKDDKDGKGRNTVGEIKSHIEISIPLIFDKVNNQDAFYADKFTLGTTSIAKGVVKGALQAMGKIEYSVQPEVEAFTSIIRSNDRRLIRFIWGDQIYEGVLNTVDAEYQMFNVNGEPIRAKVTLRLVLLDSDYDKTTPMWTEKYKDYFGVDAGSELIGKAAEIKSHMGI